MIGEESSARERPANHYGEFVARPPAQDHRADAPFGLSARELEVLRLLVGGGTDNEIAGALFISKRTVATHVRHIYDKLDVSSRAAAAAWAVRRGLA